MVATRTATLADEAALAHIDELTWTVDVTPAFPRPAGPFFREGSDPADVLVAEDGGDVVGYVSLHQTIALASHRHVLEVSGLAVHPDHQRRGVARALLDEVVALARGRGATKLSLRVLGSNPSAQLLYASYGFVVEGLLVGEFELEGRLVDDVLMARSLVPLPTPPPAAPAPDPGRDGPH